jgi:hypothetical protein
MKFQITFNIPPVTDFKTDEDQKDDETLAKLESQEKIIDSRIAAISAEQSISTVDPIEMQIQDLADGIVAEKPKSKADRITELKYQKRDIRDASDIVARKQKKGLYEVGRQLANHLKKPHDALERQLVDALIVVHGLHMEYFAAKRHLINSGIGIYTNFLSNIDDVLGIPVDNNTELAKFFREAVKKGLIKKMPAGLLA